MQRTIKHSLFYPVYLTLALVCAISLSHADDWPRWLGPEGDSIWRESGVLKEFPAGGLKNKWQHPVGLGYAGPAVAKGKVYVMDYVKTSGEIRNQASWKDDLRGKERILCLSVETGELIWKHEYDRAYFLSYPAGPRCTPTIADGKVYTLGTEGDLLCLDAESGERYWSKSLNESYGTTTPLWGYAAHPLVVGNQVFCIVGGEGSIVVAFNKDTGEEQWRALSAAERGYCPPSMIDSGGKQQLLIWHGESLNSLNPVSGEVYWTNAIKPSFGLTVAAPRLQGSLLFVTGMSSTSALLKLNDEKPGFETLWKGTSTSSVHCNNSTPVMTKTMIFGCDVESSALIGVRVADGKRMWQTTSPTVGDLKKARHGTAFIVRHLDSDRYFLFSETGDLILAEMTASDYREIGRQRVLEPTNNTGGRSVVWSHPAFAEKSMFARNDKEIVRVDLAANAYKK